MIQWVNLLPLRCPIGPEQYSGTNPLHGMRLYDRQGHRQYVTPGERDAFLKAAEDAEDRHIRTFCAMLAYTGCRISEALDLTADRVDVKDGVIVLESLKKRRRGVYLAVPVPRRVS